MREARRSDDPSLAVGDLSQDGRLVQSPAFYVTPKAQLGGARAEFDTFDAASETRFGMAAPNLSDIRKGLQDCAWLRTVINDDSTLSPLRERLDMKRDWGFIGDRLDYRELSIRLF